MALLSDLIGDSPSVFRFMAPRPRRHVTPHMLLDNSVSSQEDSPWDRVRVRVRERERERVPW